MHIYLGIYTGLVGSVIMLNSFESQAGLMLGTIVGSAFPDIDSPSSIISKRIPVIPKLCNKKFGHRGSIHTFIIPAIIISIIFLLDATGYYKWLGIGFTTGYTTHLIQDLFTKGGIRFFYPFSKKKYRIGFLKSGSMVDPIITSLLATAITMAMMFCKI